MKLQKKKLIFTFTLLCAVLLCACAYACGKSYEQSQYAVKFIIDGEVTSTAYADFGEQVSAPEIACEDGKVFKGWYKTDEYIEKWDFQNETVKDNVRLYGYYVEESAETFNILYYDNGRLINYEIAAKNSLPSAYNLSDKEGYEFIGWQNNGNPYDFSLALTDDVILNANWKLINYSLKFIADDIIIKDCTYNIENIEVTVPPVPTKQHYDAEWEKFKLELEDLEINAIYTPIIYNAIFVADEIEIESISYTIEDEIPIPPVPDKAGYNGVWTNSVFEGDVTVTAVYSPITYMATYKAENIIIDEINFTVENKDIVPPDVPKKDGYYGKWEEAELKAENIIINAIYLLIQYNIKFVEDNLTVAEFYFDAEHKTINEPELTEKAGYTGSWEKYELTFNDIVVNAIFIPIVYKADFYIDEIKISSTDFTVEDNEIELPETEVKQGYTFKWKEYEIKPENLDIVGRYTPITYYVIFKADDLIIDKIEYTVENKTINEPIPPEKTGLISAWENYELTIGDLTVNAIYFPETSTNTNDFTYKLNQDGTYAIIGYSGASECLIFPSNYNGTAVSTIGNLNFENSEITKDNIKSIKLNEGIKTIENDAFYCFNSLIEVILPDSLDSIGERAFAYCPFTEIELPENLSSIGEKAFAYSAIKQVTIPDKIKEIQDIFYNCINLEKVTLGSSVEEIMTNAFYSCTTLSQVFLNVNLKKICTHSFLGCKSLNAITIPESVILIENEAFYGTDLNTVKFERVIGWVYTDENSTVLGEFEPERIADPITAAFWLTEVFKSRNWKLT